MESSRKPSMSSTYVTDKRISQWEELMRKFSEAHKEQFKTATLDIPRAERSTKYFPTGSHYEGSWDVLGMSGYGVYTFPNGVVYEGDFEDGMFHGKGQLRYESGMIVRGKFVNGVLTERTLLGDNMEYTEDSWKYCMMPDRRFEMEYDTGLKPGGQSNLTAEQPTRDIPPGYYDTGDGFYDPKTKVIYKYEDMSAIMRSATVLEQQWIVKNCRVNPEKPLGPCSDLYEEYTEPVLKPEPPPPPAAGVKSVMASFRTQSMYEDFEFYTEPSTYASQELLTHENSFDKSLTCIQSNDADDQLEAVKPSSDISFSEELPSDLASEFYSTIMSRKCCTGSAFIVKKRIEQWENFMRKYSEKHKETCKDSEMPPSRPKDFPTGSSYVGEFDTLGMSGYGEYTFPNGVVYRGHFEDGMFHGHGELVYNDGPEANSVIRGVWVKGVLTHRKVLFNGNLEYDENHWKYCKLPDRRYGTEYETDLMPAGKSHITPDDPPREIPLGFYDTGNAFYNPETKAVHDYERQSDVIRGPSLRERKWMVDCCRKEPLGTVGPRPDYYETWTAPVPEPAPLPNPIVGFKKITNPSLFEQDYEDSAQQRPVFYDPTSLIDLQSVPQRKFQSTLNFLD